MNLPNKLTMLRLAFIPLIVIVYYVGVDVWPLWPLLAGLFFLLAALTDLLDGYFARKLNQVTDFGKTVDAVADKLLTAAALIILCVWGRTPAWVVIILICREFAVNGVKMVAASHGKVVAADRWGKLKTILLDTAITTLFWEEYVWFVKAAYIGEILMYASLAASIFSMIMYIKNNMQFLKGSTQ